MRVVVCTLALLASLFSSGLGRENFIGWTRYYVGPAGVDLDTDILVAHRSMWAEGGLNVRQGIERIKAVNPDFRYLAYNSLTDNYDNVLLPGSEQAVIDSMCALKGWDPEEAYIHFYDDTMIDRMDYTTNPPSHTYLAVPGCGPGGPTRGSRIPTMNRLPPEDPQSRKVTNFSTPTAMKLQRLVVLNLGVDRRFDDGHGHTSTLYPDGIWVDNTAGVYYGFGGGDWTFVYGGHVWETAPGDPGSMALMGTPAYDAWHWQRNVGPFLTALRDTLEHADLWHPDHKRKYLAINCGPGASRDFITWRSADMTFHEFTGNPIRDWWPPIETVRQETIDLEAAGISRIFAPYPTRTYGGGSITWDQAYEGALAYYLLVRSDETKFHYQAANSPGQAGWDTLTWHPAADVVRARLGFFRGEPYIIASGDDPLGQPYKVWARQYDNGLVLLRKRESYDQIITPNTAVTVSLPKALHRLDAEGHVDEPVTSVSIGNGRGMLFLDNVAGQPPPSADFVANPLSGSTPLQVAFTDRSSWSPTSWEWTFGDGGASTAQNPTHTYETAGAYTVTLTVRNATGSDSESRTDYITVTETVRGLPVADFAGIPTSGSAPLSVAFHDNSTGDPTSWSWTFGDGGTSSLQNPVHTYAERGSYDVVLVVANATGSDSTTKRGYIEVTGPRQRPTAAFHAVPRSGKPHLRVTFIDQSLHDPTAWLWDFGDGETSTARNPVHLYNSKGIYNVTLTVTNEYGSDSLSQANYITVSEDGSPSPLSIGYSRPNPFRESTTISYSLPADGRIDLSVYSAEGKRVRTLAEGVRPAGIHYLTLDTRDWVAGVYLFRLSWEGEVRTMRGIVLR